MEPVKLFMLLLGCKPTGRNTEQHDIFFGIAPQVKGLVLEMITFWPEANQKIHLDAWRAVEQVGEYDIKIMYKTDTPNLTSPVNDKLFFINLGGYKADEFEEFHYKMLVVAKDKAGAINEAKRTAFYQHTGTKQAPSHVDDQYGIDVDDLYEITDILSPQIKDKYLIVLTASSERKPDKINLGYMPLKQL